MKTILFTSLLLLLSHPSYADDAPSVHRLCKITAQLNELAWNIKQQGNSMMDLVGALEARGTPINNLTRQILKHTWDMPYKTAKEAGNAAYRICSASH